jgi:GNAT superfamily N-acetyltransferase
MALEIEVLKSGDMAPVLTDLARLRIEVFRAFPYLYDGDLAYEQGYLDRFSRAEGAVIVVARDGARVVGASTGAPLAEVEADFAEPFEARGAEIADIFYCAESVLLPDYRGRGLGHAFFDHREAQARALGKGISTFCSVIRPPDHPARPEGYRPLDGFWRKRGYAPLEGATVSFDWKDIGDAAETAKRLQVWSRRLD